MVTAIEYISNTIQKYIIKQPSTGIIGADTTISTIFNRAAFPNDEKYIYLDKSNPQILMTGDTIKPFNNGISQP